MNCGDQAKTKKVPYTFTNIGFQRHLSLKYNNTPENKKKPANKKIHSFIEIVLYVIDFMIFTIGIAPISAFEIVILSNLKLKIDAPWKMDCIWLENSLEKHQTKLQQTKSTICLFELKLVWSFWPRIDETARDILNSLLVELTFDNR